MPVYTSSVAPQLAAFKRTVEAVTRRVLISGGKRFRSSMIRERLSGPPGLYRKSGRLQRSLMPTYTQSPDRVVMGYKIGGTIAYYAAQHEAGGKLGFRATFAREAVQTIDELRMALRFVIPGAAREAGLAAGGALLDVVGMDLPTAGAETSWAKERFDPKTRFGQKNLQGRSRWMKSTLSKYGAAGAKTKFRTGESDAGKIDWAKGRKIMDAARAARTPRPPKLGTWKTIVEHRAPKPRKWRW